MFNIRHLRTFQSLIKTTSITTLVGLLAVSNCFAQDSANTPSYEVVLTSEVNWEHLNPARGDKSPSAGTLWGDRKGNEPTGYLLKPTDGFKSPPHIQNVSVHQVSSKAETESIIYVRTDGKFDIIPAQSKK